MLKKMSDVHRNQHVNQHLPSQRNHHRQERGGAQKGRLATSRSTGDHYDGCYPRTSHLSAPPPVQLSWIFSYTNSSTDVGEQRAICSNGSRARFFIIIKAINLWGFGVWVIVPPPQRLLLLSKDLWYFWQKALILICVYSFLGYVHIMSMCLMRRIITGVELVGTTLVEPGVPLSRHFQDVPFTLCDSSLSMSHCVTVVIYNTRTQLCRSLRLDSSPWDSSPSERDPLTCECVSNPSIMIH